MDRILQELQFHDTQARLHAASGVPLVFEDDDYLDHETWIRPGFEQLGDVRGLNVLDFGCGHGMAAVVLARRGAIVTAFDLSRGYVEESRNRAAANKASVQCVQANGELLPFADASFERIWGCAILHHLDLFRTARELYRILRPGGFAVFCEPWGGNPLLNFARGHLPYRGKHRTPDETPLTPNHVRQLRLTFPEMTLRGFQLVSMVRRVVGASRLRRSLDWCDSMLLNRVPALERFCRYVVLTLPKSTVE